MIIKMRNGDIMIMSVTMMDIVTAMLILFYPHPLLVARLGIFYQIFPVPYMGAFLMLLAAFLACYGLFVKRMGRWKFLFFIPQHAFLLLTTGSAVDFILLHHYADGVIRPWQFILQDQLPTIALTVGYAYAIFDFIVYPYGPERP